MKITRLILLFFISSLIVLVGAYCKITKTDLDLITSNQLLIIGIISEAIILLLLCIFLVKKTKNKS